MATIPVDRLPTVLPEGALPYSNVQGATPDAFGAGVGASLQQAGDTVSDNLLRAQGAANQTKAVQSDSDYLAKANDLMNGNPAKGIIGFRSLHGQAAVDAYDSYRQQLADLRTDIRSNLNPAVQRMFDQTSMRTQRGFEDSMGFHMSQQQFASQVDTANARVQIASNAALSNADDPNAWNHFLSEVQGASRAKAQLQGLTPDAAEMQRERDVSAVYEQRTRDLALVNPEAAAKFYQSNIGAIVPEQRFGLEAGLRTSNDAWQSHHDGLSAYQTVIGSPSAPTLPANMGSSVIKPLTADQVSNAVAAVKRPSQWDDAINAAAAAHGVNPYEIKLKMQLESGGNPNAVNPTTGATGLGQFTDETAKRLGITDRTDPQQSIDGIARLLAGSGGTTGGNMAGADRAYYGGSTTAQGPNTNQYVENTRAVRQALFGGGAPAPLTIAQLEGSQGQIVLAAQAAAQARRPGDPLYAEQTVNAALAPWRRDLDALKGAEYQGYSTILGASTGDNGARSLSDLTPQQQQLYATLSPESQRSLQNLWLEQNHRDLDRGPTLADRQKYLALLGQASLDPAAFMARDIAADVSDLPRQYQNGVIARFASVNSSSAKSESLNTAMQTLQRTVLGPAGMFPPTDKTPVVARQNYAAFAGALDQELDDFRNRNKRGPTDKELIDVGRGLLSSVQVPGGWFGLGHDDVPVYKLSADNVANETATIPPAFRSGIVAAFQRQGVPQPSEAQVQSAYLLHLRPDLVGQAGGAAPSAAPAAPQGASSVAPTSTAQRPAATAASPALAPAPASTPVARPSASNAADGDSPAAAFARSRARMAKIAADADAADAKTNAGHWDNASVGATARWVPDPKQ